MASCRSTFCRVEGHLAGSKGCSKYQNKPKKPLIRQVKDQLMCLKDVHVRIGSANLEIGENVLGG